MALVVPLTETMFVMVGINVWSQLFKRFHDFGIGALADGTQELLERIDRDHPFIIMGLSDPIVVVHDGLNGSNNIRVKAIG